MGDDTYFDELGEIMNNWTSFFTLFYSFPPKIFFIPHLNFWGRGNYFQISPPRPVSRTNIIYPVIILYPILIL